jgi:lipopolysaccharide export system protein LptA
MKPPYSSDRGPEPAQSTARSGERPGLLFGMLTCFAALLLTTECHAEKADRDKPIHVEADRMEYDDQRKINTFIGRVLMTKGTIVIRADRLVVREDPEGYQYGLALGKPASFRQKREGLDEFVEGYGESIDYDGKVEVVTLTGQASLRRLEGEKLTDEVHGARIVYQGQTEFYTVEGSIAGKTDRERVRVVIQPRRGSGDTADPPASTGGNRPGAPKPAPQKPLPLKPAPGLGASPIPR